MKRLTGKRSWAKAKKNLRNEYGYSHIWKRLNQIENILGDDYDLDRLRELVKAASEYRVVIMPDLRPLARVAEKLVQKVSESENGELDGYEAGENM